MMKTKRRMIRTLLAGLLMSAALLLAAGPVTPTAEAGPQTQIKNGDKTKRSAPRKKKEMKPRKRSSDRPQAKRAEEVRRPAKSRKEVKRPEKAKRPSPSKAKAKNPKKVRRPQPPQRGDTNRGQLAPPANGKNRRGEAVRRDGKRRGDHRPSRDGKVDRRDRRGDRNDRGHDVGNRRGGRADRKHDIWHRRSDRGGRGHDSWHHRVERRRDYWHYAPRHWFPRYVRLAAHHRYPRHYRPWYTQARRIYIHDDPFYFHVGLDLYVGGLAIQFELRNEPPWGYVYYDPYCDEVFWTLTEFRHHMSWYDHPPLLTLIDAEYCEY